MKSQIQNSKPQINISAQIILFIICCLIFGILKSAHASPKPDYHWNLLADGIAYTKYSFTVDADQRTTIHAFQIDPTKVKLNIVTADPKLPQGSTVKALAKEKNAAIVINGGFFTAEHKSIGLLIQSNKIISPVHKTSWWSIFGIKNNVPFIAPPKGFNPSRDTSMAVQAGPRLVINGLIPKLKEGIAPRSVVGITKNNKIVLVVTEGSPITLAAMANRMKKSRYAGGLECPNAMALDGGGSTQLYAKIKKFELSVDGLSHITNGLAVFLK